MAVTAWRSRKNLRLFMTRFPRIVTFFLTLSDTDNSSLSGRAHFYPPMRIAFSIPTRAHNRIRVCIQSSFSPPEAHTVFSFRGGKKYTIVILDFYLRRFYRDDLTDSTIVICYVLRVPPPLNPTRNRAFSFSSLSRYYRRLKKILTRKHRHHIEKSLILIQTRARNVCFNKSFREVIVPRYASLPDKT